MPSSVVDWVTSLAPVVVMSGAFIYAGCVHLRSKYRRRRGIVAPDVPAAYRPRAEERARLARDAERIVSAEFGRVAPLYDEPKLPAPRP
ncbi:hypothetical protein [Streptomyces collinus]|uniref:hypothetical protein n=1 Tax=Streptomyces collinus TaxID=42684 RepID=UPI0038054F02